MSLPAKIALGCAFVFSASIIGYVHYKQQYDRNQMHKGVLKDMETRQRRKTENLYNLQKQIDLTKELKKQNSQQNS